jgi:hypothetical protein
MNEKHMAALHRVTPEAPPCRGRFSFFCAAELLNLAFWIKFIIP